MRRRCLLVWAILSIVVQDACSKRHHPAVSQRIVGGNRAPRDAYPYFVQIDFENGDPLCGGSMVHDDIVLCAAHCYMDPARNDLIAIVNAFNAYEDYPGEVVESIIQAVRHPDFQENSFNLKNDFMLIKLENPVPNAATVTLNTDSQVPETGEELTVIGLGVTSENGSPPEFLQEADVEAYSDSDCRQRYSGLVSIEPEAMFCAGIPQGGVDACAGDSGGPLLQKGTNNQVGVTSFGYGCALATHPGVYARVSAVEEWIQSQICEMSSVPPTSCGSSTEVEPTFVPTNFPTFLPTIEPSVRPTTSPPTRSPTDAPTRPPTLRPTSPPTTSPTDSPTNLPSASPTEAPSALPTTSPSDMPSLSTAPSTSSAPSETPTTSIAPSDTPSERPTTSTSPTDVPSTLPSASPTTSAAPSDVPTTSAAPTSSPSAVPSDTPTSSPTSEPTSSPTTPPTNVPTPFMISTPPLLDFFQLPTARKVPLQRPPLSRQSTPACHDDGDATFGVNGSQTNCEWLASPEADSVRKSICQDEQHKAYTACQFTCNTCTDNIFDRDNFQIEDGD